METLQNKWRKNGATRGLSTKTTAGYHFFLPEISPVVWHVRLKKMSPISNSFAILPQEITARDKTLDSRSEKRNFLLSFSRWICGHNRPNVCPSKSVKTKVTDKKEIKKQTKCLPQTWGIPSWRICCRDRQYDVGMCDKMTDGCRNYQYPPNRFHRHRSTDQ